MYIHSLWKYMLHAKNAKYCEYDTWLKYIWKDVRQIFFIFKLVFEY